VLSQLGTGNHFSLVLDRDDGTVYSFGENVVSQLGRAAGGEVALPTPLPVELPAALDGSSIREVSAGLLHGAVLTDDGDVDSWGFGNFGRLGLGDEATRTRPEEIAALEDVAVVDILMGNGASYALDAEGRLYAWGRTPAVSSGSATRSAGWSRRSSTRWPARTWSTFGGHEPHAGAHRRRAGVRVRRQRPQPNRPERRRRRRAEPSQRP
jgi:alpha-tubulin suppressor-like RCC1 family protein